MSATVKYLSILTVSALSALASCSSHQATQSIADPNTNGHSSGASTPSMDAASDEQDASSNGAPRLDASPDNRDGAAQHSSDAARFVQRELSFDRAITAADLQGRSLRELAIMRNMPYARHGHRFRRPWLSAHFATYEWYHPTHTVADSELTAVELANARTVAQYDLTLTNEALLQMKATLLDRDQRQMLVNGDDVEAVLLSTRLGTHIELQHYWGTPDSSPLDNVERLEQLIPREELLQMSQRDLWLLRNMIYGYRGRPFRSVSLRNQFEGADWYHPNDHYNDSALRRIDRQNIRLIQSVEAEIGGPTNARDEDQMFQGA